MPSSSRAFQFAAWTDRTVSLLPHEPHPGKKGLSHSLSCSRRDRCSASHSSRTQDSAVYLSVSHSLTLSRKSACPSPLIAGFFLVCSLIRWRGKRESGLCHSLTRPGSLRPSHKSRGYFFSRYFVHFICLRLIRGLRKRELMRSGCASAGRAIRLSFLARIAEIM